MDGHSFAPWRTCSDVPEVIRPLCKAPRPPSDTISRKSHAHPGAIQLFVTPCSKHLPLLNKILAGLAKFSLEVNPRPATPLSFQVILLGSKFPAASVARLIMLVPLLHCNEKSHRSAQTPRSNRVACKYLVTHWLPGWILSVQLGCCYDLTW